MTHFFFPVFLGVMELYRIKGNAPFTDKDQEVTVLLKLLNILAFFLKKSMAFKVVILF